MSEKEKMPDVEFKIKNAIKDDILKVPKEILDELFIDEEEDDDDFKDQDITVGKIVLNNVKFKFIHGYPGDNLACAIYNDSVTHYIDENTEESIIPVVMWYLENKELFQAKK